MTSPDRSAAIEPASRRKARQRMGGGLLAMGVLHVVVPKPFEAIVPKVLGRPRFWNLLAAAAEAGAGGLLLSADPKRQRAGAALATATIVGVYPANLDMARQAGRPTNAKALFTWARLPLQLPMIKQAYELTKPVAAAS